MAITTPGLLRQPAAALPRRQDAPGSTLELLVLSTGARHCVGVDLSSGALVRAWCAGQPGPDPRLCPYDVVEVTIAPGQDMLPDPSEPEAVAVAGPLKLRGRLRGRRAARLMRPLLHPPKAPLLGFWGPAIPFWERRADHPSVALAEPLGPLVVTSEEGNLWCHFEWAGRPHVLACTDSRLAAFLNRRGRSLATLRPGTYIVVALEPPLNGHCHKVVESVVPRR
jgi:hypothetical protein